MENKSNKISNEYYLEDEELIEIPTASRPWKLNLLQPKGKELIIHDRKNPRKNIRGYLKANLIIIYIMKKKIK